MTISNKDLATYKCIYEGSSSVLYLFESSEYYIPVVIKILREQLAAFPQIARYANEYKIIENLKIPGIRRAYKYLTIGGRQALILQYIDGVTIKEALKKEINILLEKEGKPKKYDVN